MTRTISIDSFWRWNGITGFGLLLMVLSPSRGNQFHSARDWEQIELQALLQTPHHSLWPRKKSSGQLGLDGSLFGSFDLRAQTVRGSLGPVADHFGGNWEASFADTRHVNRWEKIPPLIGLQVEYRFTDQTALLTQLETRGDLAAWHTERRLVNVPWGWRELDINEPDMGYLYHDADQWGGHLGRFPLHWSPSPLHGMMLSNSVPYFDGLHFFLRMQRVRFDFLLAGLNPWLNGTPKSAGESFPEGTEEWRQRQATDGHSNAHRRLFSDPVKTLVAHRLTLDMERFEVGLTELLVAGGKSPSLRDMSPFVALHNNFDHGYTNLSVSLDFQIRPIEQGVLLGELFLDDVNFSPTETEDDTPTIWGAMVGATLFGRNSSWGDWFVAAHWMATHSLAYMDWKPLSSGYSREVLRGNYWEIDDDSFIDTYIVDHPLGYFRGPDVWDSWLDVVWAPGPRHRLALKLGWLQKGDKTNQVPFGIFQTEEVGVLSGIVEERFVSHLQLRKRLKEGVVATTVYGGGDLAWVKNSFHRAGVDAVEWTLAFGLDWRWQ